MYIIHRKLYRFAIFNIYKSVKMVDLCQGIPKQRHMFTPPHRSKSPTLPHLRTQVSSERLLTQAAQLH